MARSSDSDDPAALGPQPAECFAVWAMELDLPAPVGRKVKFVVIRILADQLGQRCRALFLAAGVYEALEEHICHKYNYAYFIGE